MEDVREDGVSVRRLNTKGCCFLCLQIEDVSRTDDDNLDNAAKCYSMRQLFRHLQINKNFIDKISNSPAKLEDHFIEANLCKICGEINGKVAKICRKLEILQLELNYELECIHTRVAASAKESDLVQNYSRRMTSDLDSLSQMAFVDNLRKELATKCLKMRNGPIPIIQVTKFKKRYERSFVKQEKPDFEDESDVEMNFDPPSPFSPYLPDYAKSEPSPSSSTPEEMEFNANPVPEVVEPKPPQPSTSLSSVKYALDANFSSETQSPSKNKKEKQSNARRLPQDVYCLKNETTGMFHCKHCSSSFKSLNGVGCHYKIVHLHLKQKCKICEKMVGVTHISKHEKACRRRLATQNDPKPGLICNQCGRNFETRKKCYDHELKVHRNANRYPCHLCDKIFKKRDNLMDHRDAVHLGKRFYCQCCSKRFSYKGDLRVHERNCMKKLNEEPPEKL